MAIKKASDYTDKNRPSGYYMVNGKRRYWSAENKKYYADQVGSTDDTLERMGVPNPAGAVKRAIKGDPANADERIEKLNQQLQIERQGGRLTDLGCNYKVEEMQAAINARRARGEMSNIPANVNEQPAQKDSLKMLTDKQMVSLGEDEKAGIEDAVHSTEPDRDKVARPMNTAETKAAGKDPMHVWALHNQKMIRRNGNQKQNDILDEALAAKSNKSNLKASEQPFVKPNRNRLTSDSRTSIFTGIT